MADREHLKEEEKMELIYNTYKKIMVVELFGELDHHQAAKCRVDIDKAMENYSSKDLVLDFSKITFMDSAGIGVILGRYRKITEKGGNVVIASCSRQVRNILNLAGIFSIIRYTDTKEDAIEYLDKNEEVS